GVQAGGAIFLQGPYDNPGDVGKRIPVENPKANREKKIRVLYTDMVKIAREIASEPDLQMRMQGIVLLSAYPRLSPAAAGAHMTEDQVHGGVEKALRKYFGKRGDRVVQDSRNCVKRGYSEMKEVPADVMAAN